MACSLHAMGIQQRRSCGSGTSSFFTFIKHLRPLMSAVNVSRLAPRLESKSGRLTTDSTVTRRDSSTQSPAHTCTSSTRSTKASNDDITSKDYDRNALKLSAPTASPYSPNLATVVLPSSSPKDHALGTNARVCRCEMEKRKRV